VPGADPVLRIERTSGTATRQSRLATVKTAPPTSTGRVPSAAASGPAIARPIGRRAVEPIQSHDATRPYASVGICCCTVVS
jgi:hypothetical protein